MTINTSNVVIATDSFATWITKTNQIAYNMSTVVLTANATSGVTAGNSYLIGTFSSNTVAVAQSIRGGNVEVSNTLTVVSPFLLGNSSVFTVSTSGGCALFFANAATLTTTSAFQLVDNVSITAYRSSKYLVQIECSVGHQISELLVIQDGTNSYLTEYAMLSTTGTPMGVFTSNVNSGYVQLLVTPTNINSNITFQRTSLII